MKIPSQSPTGNYAQAKQVGLVATQGVPASPQPQHHSQENGFVHNLPMQQNYMRSWQPEQFSAVQPMPMELLQTTAAITAAANNRDQRQTRREDDQYRPVRPTPHDPFLHMSSAQLRHVPTALLFNMRTPGSMDIPPNSPVPLEQKLLPSQWTPAGRALKASTPHVNSRSDKRQAAHDLFDSVQRNAKLGVPNLAIVGDIHSSIGGMQMIKDNIDEACSPRGKALGMDTLYMELSRNSKGAQRSNLLNMLEQMGTPGNPSDFMHAAHLMSDSEKQAIHNAEILRYASERGMRIKLIDTQGDAIRANHGENAQFLLAKLKAEKRGPTPEEVATLSDRDIRSDAMTKEVLRETAKGHGGILCVGARHVPRMQNQMTDAKVNSAALQFRDDDDAGIIAADIIHESSKYPKVKGVSKSIWLSAEANRYQ